jgi:hypothetical protein
MVILGTALTTAIKTMVADVTPVAPQILPITLRSRIKRSIATDLRLKASSEVSPVFAARVNIPTGRIRA